MSAEPQNSLNRLYQDILIDHHREPRNFGKLESADCHAEGFNPMCGDRVELSLQFSPDKKRCVAQKFSGQGCSICMASASMMTEEIEGKSIADILQLAEKLRLVLLSKESEETIGGDLKALLGVKQYPVRIKCALLPWSTLKDAIEKGCAVIRKMTEKEDCHE